MEQQEITLGDLVHIKHGWAFKGEYFSESGKYIVVTPGNFFEDGGFRLREGKEKYYLDDFPRDYLLKKNDLILAMTEQGEGLLGSPALIPNDDMFLHNQRIGLVQILDNTVLCKEYLYYLFFTSYIRKTIANTSTGTKVRHTSPRGMYKLKINLPPLKTQQKIASLLSNYDKLIENNTQRITLLESMAEELYKEWFVRLRFPGYEDVEVVDGVPEGWERKSLFDLSNVIYGYPLKSSLFNEKKVGIPLIRIRDIKNNFSKTYTEELLEDKKYFLKNGDLLVGMDGDFHMGIWSGGHAILNQRVVCFRPFDNLSKYFFYFAIKKDIDFLNKIISGTTVAHLSDKDLKKITLLIPSNDIMDKFKNIIDYIFELRIELDMKNQTLKQTRDLLLPRLMSGKLNVEDLDII